MTAKNDAAPPSAVPPTSRSWAEIAASPELGRSDRVLNPLISVPQIDLPVIKLNQPVLTHAQAIQIVRDHPTASPRKLAAARALLNDIGAPVTLSPTTGKPVQPPPSVIAIGLAPSSDPNLAFTSLSAVQRALLSGAALAHSTLPPHAIIPGVGKWPYVYALESVFI